VIPKRWEQKRQTAQLPWLTAHRKSRVATEERKNLKEPGGLQAEERNWETWEIKVAAEYQEESCREGLRTTGTPSGLRHRISDTRKLPAALSPGWKRITVDSITVNSVARSYRDKNNFSSHQSEWKRPHNSWEESLEGLCPRLLLLWLYLSKIKEQDLKGLNYQVN
jgi:hypothetical protein